MGQCKRWAAECKRGCTDQCFIELHKIYRPSNGTEGMIFEEHFCSNCIHDNPDPNHPKKCELIIGAYCAYPTDPEYPIEWKYDALGHPTCTKFVNWDWNKDGDPDDPDNPNKPPDPPDPNQLNLFPLYPNEETFIPLETIVPKKLSYAHSR